MSDDLRGLPPRQALPDDVRDRLRAEVREGIAKPRRSRHVWYAAAAVVVLAAGAVVATQVFRQPADVGPGPAPAPGPVAGGGLTLDARLATSSLDRCWAAVQAAGKADRVPPREEWVPLFTQVLQADTVVAATAAGKPMFCETTETTVTLSDPGATPTYVPATSTGVLLHSATGLVGGVADQGRKEASLGAQTEGGDSSSQSIRSSPVSRQFVVFTRADPARTTLTLDPPAAAGASVVPAAPPPLLSVTDRPAAADRTSPAGRALGECLTAAEEVVPDAASYRPGPLLDTDGYRAVMGRRGDRVLVCTTEPDYQRPGKTKSRVYPDFVGPETPPVRNLRVSTLGAVEAGGERGKSRTPFPVVLPASATAAGFEFRADNGADAVVIDGMALVWVPRSIGVTPEGKVRVRAWDAKDTLVYDGSLPLA